MNSSPVLINLLFITGTPILPFSSAFRCWWCWSANCPDRATGCCEWSEAGTSLCVSHNTAVVLRPNTGWLHWPCSHSNEQPYSSYHWHKCKDTECQLGLFEYHNQGISIILIISWIILIILIFSFIIANFVSVKKIFHIHRCFLYAISFITVLLLLICVWWCLVCFMLTC